jgi:L-threonylcarbamoyladenylate synthase
MSKQTHLSRSEKRGQVLGATERDIAFAAETLLQGDIIGMPTETVYGLAADATQGEAVARIYEAKGRPIFNPLISHVSDLEMAEEHGIFSKEARKLAEHFWPGPLTLVVPSRPGSKISDLARAGLDSVALRVPAHPVALDLIRALKRPIAAPSANRSGRISPTSAKDVIEELGEKVALVLDGGDTQIGVESTIVSCVESNGLLRQLRPGGIPFEEMSATLDTRITRDVISGPLISPGLLASHYAPLAPVRMNCTKFREGDAILAYGNIETTEFPASSPLYNLSPSGDLRQSASNLFSALRTLDAFQPKAIAVMPIPSTGLGEAINDRLSRAASPR